LGEIPAHWGIKRLKFILAEPLKYGANESAQLNDRDCPRFIRITDIAEDGSLREDTFKSLPEDIAKPFILKIGDLLFARSGTVGKTFMYREYWGRACYAGYLIRARFNLDKTVPEFISYFGNSSVYWNWISSIFIQATIKNVSAEKYANLFLSLPLVEEQKAIASFLDRETAKIDTLIQKKKRLIELLQEKRTAIINQAVTKGLNPGVPMKDSGIEWLGEIPEHWEVVAIKQCLKSCDYGISDSLRGDGIFKILTMEHVQNSTIILPEKGSIDMVTQELILDYNDLLFNRTNSLKLVGKVGIFKGNKKDKVSFASYLVRLQTNEKAEPDYLNFLLNSRLVLSKARQNALPSLNQANLNPTRYGQIKIPIPPVSEQTRIVSYLSIQTTKIDTLMAKTRTSIEKLQEYRTALISAAVTGKIDVRNNQ